MDYAAADRRFFHAWSFSQWQKNIASMDHVTIVSAGLF